MANQADVRKVEIEIEKKSKTPREKLPQDLTDEIAREENLQDREMIMAPLRRVKKALGFKKGGTVKKRMRKFEEGGMTDEGLAGAAAAGLARKSAKDRILEAMSAKQRVALPGEGIESRTENQALKKVKDVAANVISGISGSDAAKGLRNYGRMYKQGLGMKPETPYEYKKGGSVSSASKRADGCCIRGKTRA
jgi:hypothetical protein